MLSFLLNVMTSTTVDNGESSESPGRKSRKLLPRILKDHVISLSKACKAHKTPCKNVEALLHPAGMEGS